MKPKPTRIKFWLTQTVLAFLVLGWFGAFNPNLAQAGAATLSFSPNTGTFVVGSTFDVSVFLDTQQQSVNTIDLNIKFPPEKLQLVSSSTGKSIIGIWTSQPHFNNQEGTIELTGGIPGGVNVSRGLITTMTFRVRAIGSAVVKFDNSKVLLNDGFGTEIVTQNYNAIYDLVLPAPAGPLVVSETHPEQTRWYNNPNASLKWGLEGGGDGFSYVLNDQPIDTPDDISEGAQQNVVYKNLSSDQHYFHIKGLRDGHWGGVTHFALNVDVTAPAEFKVDILPSARLLAKRQPVIQFATTDSESGLDHYELKIVSLQKTAATGNPQGENQQFYIEAQSPFISNILEIGKYDVIVRAFDKAGNIRESTRRMEITTAIFQYIGNQGLEIRSLFLIPWWLLWILAILLLLLLIYIAYRMRNWHWNVHERQTEGALPEDLAVQMSELQKYRMKYGKLAIVLALATSLFASHQKVLAETQVVTPPLITTISHDVANDEIFYVGGKTGLASADVVIYLQDLQTSATISETVNADKNGDWFYRHDTFLTPGNYLLWAQTKVGDQISPPSPQENIRSIKAALTFGGNRISYEAIYLTLILILLLAVASLLWYILYHIYHGRRKHRMMLGKFTEAENSIRRGFAVLNRDLETELSSLRKTNMDRELTAEERERQEQLRKDLENIEQYMSKEIWELEQSELN